ncbi:glycosyltransferase family 2 protein [Acinetobacter junii]|nr:glycosyltransferase family 2 protein [Acinetobacter junii]MDR7654222.1 glycosyltransferase family 2 protein [Acinetobacter junii]
MTNIYSVIITFNPNVNSVLKLIESLSFQNVKVIIVDNDSRNKNELKNISLASVIFLENNFGIAKAQNVGIEQAIQNSADFILFFDQDSSIPESYVSDLMSDYMDLETRKEKIGAIGPRFIDDRHNFYYKTINLSKSGFRHKIDVSKISQPIHSSLLISSGSLISVKTLKEVGMMRENYFIDYVDTEWCIRAEALGFKNFMSAKAIMRHTIGDKMIQLVFFNVPVHSPFRRYYRVRNAIYMLREPHVPFLLFFREMIFNFIHQMILVCFEKKKMEYLRSYFNGIRDGVKFDKNN